MKLRAGVVLLTALFMAVQVVRNAMVAQFAELDPAAAASLWRDHPAVEIAAGLTAIGSSARAGKSASPAAFAMIGDAAVKAPLAPEPYLVAGVRAQLAGRTAQALQDFLAAQRRDPRSLSAAYFLAEQYFRAGGPIDGLRQIGILARLSPGGTTAVAPYVAAYARNPSNWPQIRALFQSEGGVEDPVLATLAADARNSDVILALADANHRSATSEWLPVLLSSLIASGQYSRARDIWAQVAGVRVSPGTLIYDPAFANPVAPPPFNWSLASSAIGVAERQPGGQLHVLFYGQEDGVLARQLLLLPPGTYRLSLHLAGGAQQPGALSWSAGCDKTQTALGQVTLDAAAARGWSFQVPAGCAAQWLELSGRSSDMPQQSDVTIAGLKLEQVRSNA